MAQRSKSVRLGARTEGGSLSRPPRSAMRAYTIPRQDTVRFKVVLIGDALVGKTSLALRYVKDRFNENEDSTIGASYLSHTLELEKTRVKFDLWDTAGQERYHGLAPMYYRGAQAVIVVYDICSERSFEGAKNWVSEVKQKTTSDRVMAFLGNKADLASKRVVDYQVAQSYAESNNLVFMETSAKTAMNVDEVFLAVAKRLTERPVGKEHDFTGMSGTEENISLEPRKSDSDGRGHHRCCSQ